MLKRRTLAIILVVLITVASLAGCSKPAASENEDKAESVAVGKTVEVKIATVLSESSPGFKSLVAFKDDVNEKSEGKIKITLFGNGQLGSQADTLDQARTGDIQMMTINPMSLNTTIPLLATLDNYFMFDNMEHAYKFFDGEGGQKIMDSFNSQGMQGLGILPIGFRQLTNNKKSIDSIDDMKGLKLRGYNPVQIAAWESVGCNLSSVAWGELFTSLQQGLIDGQEGALTSFAEQRFYEVQDYVTITNHVFSADALLINKDFYDALSDENRNTIDTALEAMFKENHQTVVDQTNELMSSLVSDHGTVFNEIPSEVKAEMKEKMSAITEESIVEICGQENFDMIKKFVEEAR